MIGMEVAIYVGQNELRANEFMKLRVIIFEHECNDLTAPPTVKIRRSARWAIAEEFLDLLDAESLLRKLPSIITLPEGSGLRVRAPELPILIEGALRMLGLQFLDSVGGQGRH